MNSRSFSVGVIISLTLLLLFTFPTTSISNQERVHDSTAAEIPTTSEAPTTTSEPSSGDFPGIMNILLFLSFFVIRHRKRKKT